MSRWKPTLRPEIVREIDRFRPTKLHPQVWAVIEPLVKEAVAKTVPETTYKASVVLGQAARIADWCFQRGYGIDQNVVFHPDTIDEFIASSCSHLTDGSQLNYRSQLRRIGEVLLGPPLYGPRPKAMRISDPVRPYTPDETSALVAGAKSYRTKRQREGTLCLIALGLGGGLSQGEVATACGSSVQVTTEGVVVVTVDGLRPRQTVITDTWSPRVRAMAETAGTDTLFLPGRNKASARQISGFIEGLPTNETPKLSVQRLRVTWLVRLLDKRIPLNVISDVAGIRPDQVAIYAPYMSVLSTIEAEELLRR